MRSLFLAALLLIPLSTIVRAADPLVEADRAYAKKDYAKAAELAGAAVKADPKNTNALYLLGMATRVVVGTSSSRFCLSPPQQRWCMH